MNTFIRRSGDFEEQPGEKPCAWHRGLRGTPQRDAWPPSWEESARLDGAPQPAGQHAGGQQPVEGQQLVEALLRAARRPEAVDPVAAERALDAFRSARLAGAARTRRRDDWRPGSRLRPKGAWRIALGALVASLTLGGVAYAAFVVLPERDHHRPAPHTSAVPSTGHSGGTSSKDAQPSDRPPASDGSDARPDAERRDMGHCRRYLEDHGKHSQDHRSSGYRELARSAGGEGHLHEYCAELLSSAHGRDGKGSQEDAASEHGGARSGKGSGSDRAGQGGETGEEQSEGRAESMASGGESGERSAARGPRDSGDTRSPSRRPPRGQNPDRGGPTHGGRDRSHSRRAPSPPPPADPEPGSPPAQDPPDTTPQDGQASAADTPPDGGAPPDGPPAPAG